MTSFMYLRWFWVRPRLLLTRQQQSHDEGTFRDDLHVHVLRGKDCSRAGRGQIVSLRVLRHLVSEGKHSQ
jgi:hypothetical protein